MPPEDLIAQGYAVLFTATGVSHLLQPRRWADFFIHLRAQSYGGLVIGALTLPLGLVVVLGHNVWVLDVPVVITLFGWMMTLKSIAYLVYPPSFQAVSPAHHSTYHRAFVPVGAVMTAVGSVLLYDAFLR